MNLSCVKNYNSVSFGLRPVLNCSLKNNKRAVAYEVEDNKEDRQYFLDLCDKHHDKFYFLTKDEKIDFSRDKVYVLKNQEDETLAYAKCEKAGGAMMVNFLSARRDRKPEGAGTALLAGISQGALDHNISTVMIDNPDRAWSFYYKCGFKTNDDVTELRAKASRNYEKTMYDLIDKVKIADA